MRLWHQFLLPYLPRQQLLGQHRECCALRGNGWGKPHSTVNYVFKYHYTYLVAYHILTLDELKRRGYKPDETWFDPWYRGKNHDPEPYTMSGHNLFNEVMVRTRYLKQNTYREHNVEYLNECIKNLEGKGIILSIKPFLLEGTVIEFVDNGKGSLCVTSQLYGTKATIEHIDFNSFFPYEVRPHKPGWGDSTICCNSLMIRAVLT